MNAKSMFAFQPTETCVILYISCTPEIVANDNGNKQSFSLSINDGKLIGDKDVVKQESVDVIYAVNDEIHNISNVLGELLGFLKPAGKLILREIISETKQNEQYRTRNEVLMSLMIGGFVDSSVKEIESKEDGKVLIEVATSKPSFDIGSSAKLNLANKAAPSKTWNIVVDDFDSNGADEIDEDDLLDEDSIVSSLKKRDDCEVGPGGKRRACKNCTCGRKDMDQKPVITDEELAKSVSSCGNCYKGDAFRCGSCPFLGKPAFKPGMETVLLDLDAE